MPETRSEWRRCRNGITLKPRGLQRFGYSAKESMRYNALQTAGKWTKLRRPHQPFLKRVEDGQAQSVSKLFP